MIYRLPCGKAFSVRKSLRAVRTVGRNRYIENTPLGTPSGTALRLESTLYSVERLFPLLGGVSRGSVRVGVKTFLLPFYDFSFGYKRKGVNIKKCKRYTLSGDTTPPSRKCCSVGGIKARVCPFAVNRSRFGLRYSRVRGRRQSKFLALSSTGGARNFYPCTGEARNARHCRGA